ncbi:MAG TPA: response regulator, partial [Candidatus Melainabacteria bacterium]|nr:response regulator [Candidatus Melainabacteria bacterium]
IKVLLVEDSQADARLIKEVFRDEKIMVDLDIARDGEEAMEYLLSEGNNPDLVILDLNLPRKDGREVLAEIKENKSLRTIPVVILTTSQSEEDIIKSYKLNANCYVTKPIDLDQFIKIIKSLDEFWFSAVKFPRENKK